MSELLLPQRVQFGNSELDNYSVRLNGNTNQPDANAEIHGDAGYSHFFLNHKCWDGKLTNPAFTLARKPNSLGSFHPNRFERIDGQTAHEICLNPEPLSKASDYFTLRVIAQQMAWQAREEFGPPRNRKGSSSYCDEVTADFMDAIGLKPTATGQPGGKRTGAKMFHIVVENGPFDLAARELLASGFVFRWRDRVIETQQDDTSDQDAGDSPRSHKTTSARAAHSGSTKIKKSKDRVKFTCPGCGLNAWSKPSASIKCAPCDLILINSDFAEAETDTDIHTKAVTIVNEESA